VFNNLTFQHEQRDQYIIPHVCIPNLCGHGLQQKAITSEIVLYKVGKSRVCPSMGPVKQHLIFT